MRVPEGLREYGAWVDVVALLIAAAALATVATLVVSCSRFTIDRAAQDVSAACAAASAVLPLVADAGAHD